MPLLERPEKQRRRQDRGVSLLILILTGASGAGKTSIAKALGRIRPDVRCFFFDSIGVPSTEQMIAEYGSGEEWQRAKTIEWLSRLKKEATSTPILFEGQARISFLLEAIRENEVKETEIILIDCTDEVRNQRLRGPRAQPELANTQMMNWARYLRNEAHANGLEIMDTSEKSVDDCAQELSSKLR